MLLLMGELIYLDISCFDGTLVARKVMITEASLKEREEKGRRSLRGESIFFDKLMLFNVHLWIN
jgi:hypothetical protein